MILLSSKVTIVKSNCQFSANLLATITQDFNLKNNYKNKHYSIKYRQRSIYTVNGIPLGIHSDS